MGTDHTPKGIILIGNLLGTVDLDSISKPRFLLFFHIPVKEFHLMSGSIFLISISFDTIFLIIHFAKFHPVRTVCSYHSSDQVILVCAGHSTAKIFVPCNFSTAVIRIFKQFFFSAVCGDQILCRKLFFRIVFISNGFPCRIGNSVRKTVPASKRGALQFSSSNRHGFQISKRIIRIIIRKSIVTDGCHFFVFIGVRNFHFFSIHHSRNFCHLIRVGIVCIGSGISFCICQLCQKSVLVIVFIMNGISSGICDRLRLLIIGCVCHRRFHALTALFQDPPFVDLAV